MGLRIICCTDYRRIELVEALTLGSESFTRQLTGRPRTTRRRREPMSMYSPPIEGKQSFTRRVPFLQVLAIMNNSSTAATHDTYSAVCTCHIYT